MKRIVISLIFLILISCLFFTKHSKKYEISAYKKVKQSNIIPIDNPITDLANISIPSISIDELIYNLEADKVVSLAIGSDSITSEEGNIILNCLFSLKEIAVKDHIVLDYNNSCYIFEIEEIGTLTEYNKSINSSNTKSLYLINQSEELFVKAIEFYKNNTYNLT